ncbi:hypothetical protein PPACK8108_LOCUS16205, partial [Phakopsora pachyrhizi]
NEPWNLQQSNKEITEEVQVSCQCLDITTPDNEYGRRPTNRNKKVGLNEDQSQWVVVIREEAQTDRLDYDLRGWEPVDESKISEYTEDGDLIRVKRPKTHFCLTWISPNKK